MTFASTMLDGMHFDRQLQSGREYAAALEGGLEGARQTAVLALERLHQAREGVAFQLALRCALEELIKVIDPRHDLVRDVAFRTKIGNAGITAYHAADEDLDAAKEAGRTYSVPPVEGGLRDLKRAHLEEVDKRIELQAENARLLQELTDLRVELERITRDCAHHLAQSTAFRTHLAAAEPRHPLILDSDLRRRIAEAAYKVFGATRDWKAVRDVGATFEMPRSEHLREADAEANWDLEPDNEGGGGAPSDHVRPVPRG
jgi:hypothetical protein